MTRTFNYGLGFVMIVSKSEAEAVCSQTGACTVGSLERRTGGRLYYTPYNHCSEVGITGYTEYTVL